MNFLITGGSGFVGSHLCKTLIKAGNTVFNLDIIKSDNAVSKDFTINILDKNSLNKVFEENKIDIIIHSCAEVPITKSKNFFKVNFDGTKNILDCFLKYKVKKLVYISSSAVYGVPKKIPICEGDIREPVENYGKSKKMGEDECLNLISRGENITIIRPRTIIGGGRLGIFSFLFEWIKSDSNIPVMNNGDNKYQFVNLEDFCDAVILSSFSSFSGDINIGSNSIDTIRNNLEKLIIKANSKSKLKNLDNFYLFKFANIFQKLNIIPLHEYHFKAYGANIFFNNEKSKNILNWSSKYSDYESLEQSYINYIDSNNDNEDQSPHKKSLKSLIIKHAPKLIF